MKRQCVGGEAQLFRNLTRCHAFRPGLYKQAENVEAVILCERGQGRNCN